MRKPSRKPDSAQAPKRATILCAIYTRKSSEEGLDMEFNSLDAQREACEAYIISQKSEGWIALPQMYDDGGISGGTMERPALKRLLADIEAGLIDLVVTYKVDRLTRSLSDFARIVDVFDAAHVSFVSVTQSFNTTTSMGRLTLNMLLSFAQFEREVTGERIRDKIAASKAKGMWMGGRVPLGYQVRDRKLEIVEDEAETVRYIFRRYVELGSVFDLRDDLADAGIVTKQQVWATGQVAGGVPFGRGALYHLLQSRTYLGQISFKGQVYPGQHLAIIDEALWNAVQAKLGNNRIERTVRSEATEPSRLAGLIHDEDGIPLTPTHANKKGRRYRYYVSHDLIARRAPKAEDGEEGDTDNAPNTPKRRRSSARRIPATDLESIVEGSVTGFLADATTIDAIVAPTARDIEERRHLVDRATHLAANWSSLAPAEKITLLRHLVAAIVVTGSTIDLTLRTQAFVTLLRCPAGDFSSLQRTSRRALPEDASETISLSVPATLKRVGMEMRHLVEAPHTRQARAPDRSLIRIIAQGNRYRDLLTRGDGRSIAELAATCDVGPTYFTRILRLGFLAPDITSAILAGRQPIDLLAQRLSLIDLPKEWTGQRAALGFTTGRMTT